jgi:hypothetical protein
MMYLAETIKSNIEANSCPVHDIHPMVEVLPNEFLITCCCNTFYEECKSEVESTLAKMDITLNWNIVQEC